MGCDIHCYAEKRTAAGYEHVEMDEPFSDRIYFCFAFLAGVRNYSGIPPIAEPRGFPDDASKPAQEAYESSYGDAHTPSWLSVAELRAFDYSKPVEDRRVTIDGDGGRTAPPGGGVLTTYREALGDGFLAEVERLTLAGVDRIVFWFDN